MIRMFAVRLGVRFALASDANARWRAALVVIASAVAVVAVLTLLAIPGVMDQQGRRLSAQKPDLIGDGVFQPGLTPPLVVQYEEDEVDGSLMSRIAVANAQPEAQRPHWLASYPEPGEIVVSPEAARLLDDPGSALARRFGQRVVIQVIGDDGLVSPDQVLVIVGVTGAELAPFTSSAGAAYGLGRASEDYPGLIPAPFARLRWPVPRS